MSDIFLQLGIVLGLAVAVSLLMRYLRQPLLVGYILTGLIISVGASQFIHFDSVESLAHLGVALLLFMVGLGLKPELLYETGPVALLTGVGQIVFTALLGYGLGILLGFSTVAALYLAVAFTFSSTVIIVRLLSERGDTDSLYGRIVIGFFLVQDVVAMAILLGISLFSKTAGVEGGVGGFLSLAVFNFGLLALGIFLLGAYIIPYVDRWFAKSSELLLLFGLTVCFGVIAVFQYFEYSLEIGALLAGVILASSPYQREIAARIKSLRDFFLVIFFVSLGFMLNPTVITEMWLPALIFSAFILVGNPTIVMLVMRPMGYSLKTMFYAGLTVAQISEFSLILLLLGASLGHITETVASLGTLVGLITIAVSSYAIMHADNLYRRLRPYLKWFDDRKRHPEDKKRQADYDVFLFGAHRLGGGLVAKLKRMRARYLVVDYDPHLVAELKAKKVPAVFGDIGKWQFLDELKLKNAKLVISSVPEVESSLSVLKHLKKIRSQAALVAVAGTKEEAEELYAAGAHFVVMPQYLGRRYMADLLERHGLNKRRYVKEKKHHLRELQAA